jgi:hypothetical protein
MHVYKRDIPSLKEHSQSISVNENLEVVWYNKIKGEYKKWN